MPELKNDPGGGPTTDAYQVILDTDSNQKIELTLLGYKESKIKSLLYYLVLVMSLGFMALVFHWYAHYALVVRRKRCPLPEASYVLIIEKYKNADSEHHDAIRSDNSVGEVDLPDKEPDHEIRYVERVHRVDLDVLKEKYVQEWRKQLEAERRKRDGSGNEEEVKEKWCDMFMKRACLFEKPEIEIKLTKEQKLSKSPDTVTTLVGGDLDTAEQPKDFEREAEKLELKIYEHFSHVHHFSVHFENGIFEGEELRFIIEINNSFNVPLGILSAIHSLRFFRYKQLRYVWNEHTQKFTKLMGLDKSVPSQLLQPQYGLSIAEQMARF